MINTKAEKSLFQRLKSNWSAVLIAIVLLLLFCGVVILGEDVVIVAHDNLDSDVVEMEMMKQSDTYWAFDGKVDYLNEISRLFLPSSLTMNSFVFYLLGPFWGYVGVFFLKILVALISFTLLVKEIAGNEKFQKNKNLILIIAFTYGLLPGYPTAYFANASIPLLVFLLIKVYREPKKIIHYILILVYPIISNFILYGVFICGYLLIFIVIDIIKNKSFRMLIPFAILIAGYLIVDYRLVYLVLIKDIPTLKECSGNTPNLNFIKSTIYTFCAGQYHAESGQLYIIVPIAFVYFVVHNINNIVKKKSVFTLPNLLMLIILFNSSVFSLYYNETFRSFYQKTFKFIGGINYSRTVFFNPFFWYCLFFYIALNTKMVWKGIKQVIVIIQMFLIILLPFRCSDINLTLSKYFDIGVFENGSQWYTFSEFYSGDLFGEIKDDISYNGEKSVAFRLQPAVLNYNGISTLDGYLSYYPLDYKQEFFELILPQIENNEEYYDYFVDWGGRAYLYPNEISIAQMNSYEYDSLVGDSGEELNINMDKFRELGGRYIFSNGTITNADDVGLQLAGKYNNQKSLYTIYVYELTK